MWRWGLSGSGGAHQEVVVQIKGSDVMIGIDLSNTQLFNVGIDVFSAILALIIYFSYKHFFSESYENEQICALELILCIVLIADIGTWLLDGVSGQ